jgi:hypothetical protein
LKIETGEREKLRQAEWINLSWIPVQARNDAKGKGKRISLVG